MELSETIGRYTDKGDKVGIKWRRAPSRNMTVQHQYSIQIPYWTHLKTDTSFALLYSSRGCSSWTEQVGVGHTVHWRNRHCPWPRQPATSRNNTAAIHCL